MAEAVAQTSGTQALRPRARILRTLGDELISSETVAVIELVKNAYDADATRVLVRFQEPLEIGQGMIEVIDNGHGMSLETIQNAWMEPALNRLQSAAAGVGSADS
jgi:Histidine kinase-, DNA gyrase B-, and HSP90-like ATPase